jgi:glycosyltransferase involved in cell wall biosynthesis
MATQSYRAYRAALGVDADLYHFHDPDFLPYARLLARRGRVVVYDAHENVAKQIMAKHWIRPFARRPTALAVGALEMAVARRLAAVVCASPDNAARFRPRCRRVEVVENFPDLSEIAPASHEPEGRQVCYVGGISRVRGAFELVDAMAAVDGELLLAGPGSPESLLPELERRPGWAKVRYQGRVPRPEVVRVLQSARVGVIPLHATPNHLVSKPVKLFEYMAAGIPVVGTDVPVWADIMREHDCGLVVPVGDAGALARAITQLLDDPTGARAMGERGRAAVERAYSWQSEARKLLALYAELLA